MITFNLSQVFFLLVVFLLGAPLISLAGSGGDGGASSGLGFAANDGFYGNNTQGTVGTSDAEAGNSSGAGSFGVEFSSSHSMIGVAQTSLLSKIANAFKNAVDDLNEQYTAPPAQTTPMAPTTNTQKDESRLTDDTPTTAQSPAAPTAPTAANAGRFGPTDISPVDFGPSAPGTTPSAGAGRGNSPGGPGLGDPGTGIGNPGTPGGTPGPGPSDPGGGAPGPSGPGPSGPSGPGNSGGGPGYGADGTSNPNDWFNTVSTLAQTLQGAYSVINPAASVFGNAVQYGTNTLFNNSNRVRTNTPQYTNLSNLTPINTPTNGWFIATVDQTGGWYLNGSADTSLASSAVRFISTTDQVDAWYTNRPAETNSIVFEAKVVSTGGRVIMDWLSIPFGTLNIPTTAQLHLRWDAAAYSQCLAFFNDSGRYSLQVADRSMKTGNTETEQYDIPELTGIYSIACSKQTSGGVVDERMISVIVGN